MTNLGKIIRHQRMMWGRSLQGVAYSARCSKSYLWSIENGRVVDIGILFAARLSQTIGISLEDLAYACARDRSEAAAERARIAKAELRKKAIAKRKREQRATLPPMRGRK